ncbi:DUF3871 family protein [Flavobacteriaceae bacterium 144Ye]|nr:DUF3871 family protein [Flavobacteriaceae bacterium 144Ye]
MNNSTIIKASEVIQPNSGNNNHNNSPLIKANTNEVSLEHLKSDCIIPVFSKDNETTISHHEFIDITHQVAKSMFKGHSISNPEIRTSHIIKGRVPSAIGKPVKELLKNEKTIYYERMMFKYDIPTISTKIGDNELNLVFGGVRAYNKENLYSKKSLEKFKFFIGFKNLVCCNLCVSSDGNVVEIRSSSLKELESKIMEAIGMYEMQNQIKKFRKFTEYEISEKQFAQFIGKCRLYQHLPNSEKNQVPKLEISDNQINAIAKGYYSDKNFSRNSNGNLSLWQMYNLITGANKSSYIDSFLKRSLNASELMDHICYTIENNVNSFYLN